MRDEEVKLAVGALLHDIGKVIYREGSDRRKHSRSGYDYLKENEILSDQTVLDCVRYHHADALSHADIPTDSLAYIVYIADNIAAAVDRRCSDAPDVGFSVHRPLESIFNILNGNHQKYSYAPEMLRPDAAINFPQKEPKSFDESFYAQIMRQITENLKALKDNWTQDYVNSLLEVLEATLTYVPSATSNQELADISLFDHLKITAAAASCIYAYLQENQISDYRECLFRHAEEFYAKEVYLMASLDISGIQDFIYTITSKKALRTLRARSFYLEIIMEHTIDQLLDRLHLSRANLIYAGGGHCYMLLPNTREARNCFEQMMEEVNQWFLTHFQTALYLAGGMAACSCDALKNKPAGAYRAIYQEISAQISEKKMARYSPEQIRYLNRKTVADYGRECRVCRRVGQTNEEGVCEICERIERLSQKILYEDFFTILGRDDGMALPMPGDCFLIAEGKEALRRRMAEDTYFIRAYGKNEMYTGRYLASKIWVGNYTNGYTFEEFAQEAEGINRVGILRADVDNLGHAFVAGFEEAGEGGQYVTLSRTASLSRHLSLFFKLYINQILSKPKWSVSGKKRDARKATIVYSGGDDLFIVGAWDEVAELAVDVQREFCRYVQNTLTISAGIGIYGDSYPIHVSAREVADLETESKNYPGKNAITLLPDGKMHDEKAEDNDTVKWKISDGTWCWDVFADQIVGQKYRLIERYFGDDEDHGNALLYRLLELIRHRGESINLARYVYLLARLEPERDKKEKYQRYLEFRKYIYEWVQSEEDCRQLKTAITLYVYRNRKGEQK